ncbi:hypothetical protein CTA2_4914 [Colletotrichum tanaceti]|uniref:Uncharacterized protein n=1 Tax=Colletotrichum tanaceti TaxID=1306861 RepID=A0A4U6XPU1_9PEZI|nr:hypothetical protein CTA2_4914 [Colletotrichum tanaceti]TKW57830.1 hypothetical protein CTA1_9791 [Colletotrichum tanaceti]
MIPTSITLIASRAATNRPPHPSPQRCRRRRCRFSLRTRCRQCRDKRCLAVAMSSRCSCSRLTRLQTAFVARPTIINLTRPFSTTTSKLKVPPESPLWIQVPTPPQSQSSEVKPPVVKGTLPTPRDLFPPKEDGRKLRFKYLEATMPTPTGPQRYVPPGSLADRRRRMAYHRRQNLGIALRSLYERKLERVQAETAVRDRRLRDHQRAAVAPERWDDRLTRSSVLSSLVKTTAVELDPKRYVRAQQSKVKTAKLAQQKSEARQDALMELYINASKFIVSEDQLGKELDKLFSEDFWKRQGKSMAHDSDNAWDVWGQPPTVKIMLDEMLRKQQRAIDFHQTAQDRTVKRQKTIAEELTGGKME